MTIKMALSTQLKPKQIIFTIPS